MTAKTNRRARRHRNPEAKPKRLSVGKALSVGAAALGIGGALIAVLLRGKRNPAEHPAPDLAPGQPTPGADGRRAPVDFRPDPTAVPTKAEYDSLRPATGPSPSIVADRGELAGQSAPANG